MKLTGPIDFQGNEALSMSVEKVSSLPTHVAADKGRLLYLTTSNDLYLGVASDWVKTNMWETVGTLLKNKYPYTDELSMKLKVGGKTRVLKSDDTEVHTVDDTGQILLNPTGHNVGIESAPGDFINTISGSTSGKANIYLHTVILSSNLNVEGVINCTGYRPKDAISDLILMTRDNRFIQYEFWLQPGGKLKLFIKDIDSGALSGTTVDIPINVPAKSLLKYCAWIVKTDITGASSFDLDWYSSGIIQNIVAGAGLSKNTKDIAFFDTNANKGVTTGLTVVRATANVSNFTGGEISLICSWEEATNIDDYA